MGFNITHAWKCYISVVTWALGICLICMPSALGLLGIYIRQIPLAHVTTYTNGYFYDCFKILCIEISLAISFLPHNYIPQSPSNRKLNKLYDVIKSIGYHCKFVSLPILIRYRQNRADTDTSIGIGASLPDTRLCNRTPCPVA